MPHRKTPLERLMTSRCVSSSTYTPVKAVRLSQLSVWVCVAHFAMSSYDVHLHVSASLHVCICDVLQKVTLDAEDQARYNGWSTVERYAFQTEMVEYLAWEDTQVSDHVLCVVFPRFVLGFSTSWCSPPVDRSPP